MSGNILNRIIAHKRLEVAARESRLPLAELKARLGSQPPVRDFVAALRRPGEVALIAEVKKCSPSKGVMRPDFDVPEIVAAYREAGADAVSILTDSRFFGGSPGFLAQARRITAQPLLQKDFILGPYQVYEARWLGADAVLLIASVLGDTLGELIALARHLGMEALVETREPGEIQRALAAGAAVIGINNRDLRTFKVDIGHTLELIKYLNEPGITVVSESGIRTRADVEKLGAAGVHAVLVGEALMAGGDLRAGVAGLKGRAYRQVVAGV